jgi:hypothetical protein
MISRTLLATATAIELDCFAVEVAAIAADHRAPSGNRRVVNTACNISVMRCRNADLAKLAVPALIAKGGQLT